MKNILKPTLKAATGSALVLSAITSVFGQEKMATPPVTAQDMVVKPAAEPGTLNSFFNGALPDAIGKSKININSRLRWEHAEQGNLKESDAFTLRTRFGLTTAPLYGFQGMIEGENVTSLTDPDLYNAAGSNPGGAGKTIIADPETTELNQAWLSYTYADWNTSVKGGRQRIVLDNARFVGDVGWRQNMQTFDAVALESKPVKGLSLYYAYLWDVHRVFGDVSGLPAGNQDFDSSSHLFNVSYQICKEAKLTGYTYLLDLKNGGGAANSCATYGASITGSAPVSDQVKLDYRGEFAYQTDYADSPLNYEAEYYNVELGVNVKPVIVGGGYEVLSSDGGVASFRTPLATLHAFNGWDDVFLATPPAGLRDLYGFVQVTVPKLELPIRFVYHKFDSDRGSMDFGQEFDVVATKKMGKHWTAIAKYAHYEGENAVSIPANTDVDKIWLELSFNF